MGLGSHRVGSLLSGAALLVGVAACGSSVADSDRPISAGPSTAAATPFCAAAQHNAEALRPLNGFGR